MLKHTSAYLRRRYTNCRRGPKNEVVPQARYLKILNNYKLAAQISREQSLRRPVNILYRVHSPNSWPVPSQPSFLAGRSVRYQSRTGVGLAHSITGSRPVPPRHDLKRTSTTTLVYTDTRNTSFVSPHDEKFGSVAFRVP